ncbi:MAG: hypothetical protein J2P45_00575 [Candidatus Dormibacteraeota bacterium]|nr:hypothetical protein [Candidatus Dormibacteraeota bacterium]
MDHPLVDPTGASTAAGSFQLAPRTRLELRGATVGLLANTKFNGDTILDSIGRILQERYGVKELVRESKPYFARPVPDEMAAALASRCDLVITAIGD